MGLTPRTPSAHWQISQHQCFKRPRGLCGSETGGRWPSRKLSEVDVAAKQPLPPPPSLLQEPENSTLPSDAPNWFPKILFLMSFAFSRKGEGRSSGLSPPVPAGRARKTRARGPGRREPASTPLRTVHTSCGSVCRVRVCGRPDTEDSTTRGCGSRPPSLCQPIEDRGARLGGWIWKAPRSQTHSDSSHQTSPRFNCPKISSQSKVVAAVIASEPCWLARCQFPTNNILEASQPGISENVPILALLLMFYNSVTR